MNSLFSRKVSRRASRSASRNAKIALAALAVLALDQLTKVWVVAALTDGPIELVGSLQLRHVRNTGFAFSAGSGLGPVLTLVVPLVVLLLWRYRNRLTGTLAFVALGAVIGGALGNLADRLLRDAAWGRGGVVDFIDVGFWPVFNVADSAIVVGVVAISWNLFQGDRNAAAHGLDGPDRPLP